MANDNYPTYLLRSSEELRRPTVHVFGSQAEFLATLAPHELPEDVVLAGRVIFDRNGTWYDRNADGWRAIEVPAPANPEKLTEEEVQFLTFLVGQWLDLEERDQFWKSVVPNNRARTSDQVTEKVRKARLLLKKLQDLPVFEAVRK